MGLQQKILRTVADHLTGADVDVSADTSNMNDEQKRAIEQATIMLSIRRKIRFISIGIFLAYFVPNMLIFVVGDFSGFITRPISTTLAIGFLGLILGGTAYFVLWFLGVFLFSSVGLRVYLYLRDLFTSKGTRL